MYLILHNGYLYKYYTYSHNVAITCLVWPPPMATPLSFLSTSCEASGHSIEDFIHVASNVSFLTYSQIWVSPFVDDSQIWVSPLVDDSQFTYLTKLKNNTLVGSFQHSFDKLVSREQPINKFSKTAH